MATTTQLRGGSSMIETSPLQDSVECYLKEIGALTLLSREEVCELAQRLEQGDEEAFQTLVERNLRLVVPLAKTYLRYSVQLNDLIQEGNLGLMHAVRKFDWRRGNRFSTYATWWIKCYIRRYLLTHASVLILPVYMAEQIQAIERIELHLLETLGREPIPEEIAEAYNAKQTYANKRITTMRVEEIAVWRLTPTSLDATTTDARPTASPSTQYGPDTHRLQDILADTTQTDHVTEIEQSALHGAIEQALDKLSARERAIIRGRFGFDGQELSLDVLAKRYKLTRQRIQQVECNALKKLFRPLQSWMEVSNI